MVITISECVFVLSCLLSAAPQDSRPASAASLDVTAERIEAAFSAGDDAALRGPLSAAASDAFPVANALFARHVEARLAGRESSACPPRRGWSSSPPEARGRSGTSSPRILPALAMHRAAHRIVLLLAGALPAPGQVPESRPASQAGGSGEAAVAEAFLAAFRVGDEAGMQRLLSHSGDPVRVADALYGRHVEAWARGAPEKEPLAAAAEYARRTAGRGAAAGLHSLVLRWSLLGAAELRTEQRLREQVALLLDVDPSREPARMLEGVEPMREWIEQARGSVSALRLLRMRARALAAQQRLEEAIAVYAQVGERARELPHPTFAMLAAESTAGWQHALGRHADAFVSSREELRLKQQIGVSTASAHVRVALGAGVVGSLTEGVEHARLALREAGGEGDLRTQGAALTSLADLLFRSGEVAEALQTFDEALAVRRRADDRSGLALTLLKRGDAARLLGQLSESLELLEQCLTAYEQLRDQRGVASVHTYLGLTRNARGEYSRALEHLKLAESVFARGKPECSLGYVLAGRAEAEAALGNHATALELRCRALALHRASGDRGAAAMVLLDVGRQHSRAGRLDEAARCCTEAVASLEGLGDVHRTAQALERLSVVHGLRGEPAAALDCLREAVSRADAAGLVHLAAHIRLALVTVEGAGPGRADKLGRALQALERCGCGLGAIAARKRRADDLRDQGRYAEALARYEALLPEALRPERAALGVELLEAMAILSTGLLDHARACELFEKVVRGKGERGDLLGAAIAQANLAITYGSLGRRDREVALLEASVTELERIGCRGVAAHFQAALASALADSGRTEEAIVQVQAARAAAERVGEREPIAYAFLVAGRVHEKAGDLERALGLCERALHVFGEIDDVEGIVMGLELAARLCRGLGRPAEAMSHARAAVTWRMRMASGLGEHDASALRATTRTGADLGAWAAFHATATESRPDGVGGGDVEAARTLLWFAEAGRALSLAADLAAGADVSVPQAVRDAEERCRAAVKAQRARLAGVAAGQPLGSEVVRDARLRLDVAYGEHDAAFERLSRARGSATLQPPVALEALHKTVPADAAFVLYHLTDQDAYALVVSGAGARAFRLGAAADLVAAARRYVRIVSVADSGEEALAIALYDALLRPVEAEIVGKRRLILCPDGCLAFLPFEALVQVSGTVKRRAIELWEVVHVPSATTHTLLNAGPARSGAGGLVAVAAAGAGERTSSLPRLPEAAREARAIGALFPAGSAELLIGAAATREGLLAALHKRDRLAAVHFACHGILDVERPHLTGLALEAGTTFDLADLGALRLRCDLAVLSACETGLGKLERGEGVLGLVRGFFGAGVPRVVVSLWQVADADAPGLMVGLHRRVREEGMTPAAALRAAKLERLSADGPGAHPARWAAFVSWGRWD